MRLPVNRTARLLPEIAGGIAFIALMAAGLFAIGCADGFDETLRAFLRRPS